MKQVDPDSTYINTQEVIVTYDKEEVKIMDASSATKHKCDNQEDKDDTVVM